MKYVKWSLAFVPVSLFVIVVCLARSGPREASGKFYFWNENHLSKIFNEELQNPKVCYCIKDGKLVAFVHAWMSDDEKKALDEAPPPSHFLKDFQRPQPFAKEETP